MVRVGLAPCSPFSVTPELMVRTAELAEQLDVRLHTHLAEDADEDEFCLARFGCRPIEHFEQVGWGLTAPGWPIACSPTRERSHGSVPGGPGWPCPSSSQLIGAGLAPVRELRTAGVPVGLGCDGSASTDCASLWLEARSCPPAGATPPRSRGDVGAHVLEMATLGGAACLGRQGEIGALLPGAAADLVVWPLAGVPFAGAVTDPVEAWLRCGPVSAPHRRQRDPGRGGRFARQRWCSGDVGAAPPDRHGVGRRGLLITQRVGL